MTGRRIFSGLAQYLFLGCIGVVTFFPLLWIVVSSFKTNASILSSAISLPDRLHWENYVNAIKVTGLPAAFLNSTITSVGSVVLVVFLAFPAAYVAARFRTRTIGRLYNFISLGILVPLVAAILPIKILMLKVGLNDSLLGLVILYAGIGLPLAIVIFRSFLLSVPRELDESARIDGAGYWTVILRIIMPVSQNGIVTIMIWQFITAWNEFLFALLLIGSESKRTLQIAIRFFVGRFFFDYGGLFAAMVLIMVPPIILFAIFQERVIQGITAGAVKG